MGGTTEVVPFPVLPVPAAPNPVLPIFGRVRLQVVSDLRLLEAYEHRLGFESNAPEFFHALLDVIFQCQNVGCAGISAVYDGQSVFSGNPYSAAAVSFAET